MVPTELWTDAAASVFESDRNQASMTSTSRALSGGLRYNFPSRFGVALGLSNVAVSNVAV
jgi:hypothetical protein